jgi:uncharacterized protein
VAAALGGDGDDAALVPDAVGHLAVAAEAIWPPFLAASPRPAGVAGVVTVLNDLAAAGARPLAVLDVLVAGEERVVAEALAGLRASAELYRVPVVGGHTTLEESAGPVLATFALGRAAAPLRAAAARPGDAVCLATCLEGEAMATGGGRFFSHLRGPRRDRAAADLALVPEAAEAGEAWAARDVSMPGVAGSLLQLLESAGGLGCALELDALPVPPGLDLAQWLVTFPSYGFLLVGDPASLGARFAAVGLTCAPVGTLDGSGVLRLAARGAQAVVWDLGMEPLTGMGAR